jgi:CheY-like chemotaxis protein
MGTRILLADDSVTIQKVVELTFMDEDYEVVAVSNGDDALARLDEVQPELVIADVHMPGANGYDVCRRVKERRPRLPVLLLVGTFEPFQEEEANRAGADGYLKKPFDSQELLRRVESLLAAARSAGAEPVVTAPAEEMAAWEAPAAEEEESVEMFGGAVAEEEVPAGPFAGQRVPDELVLEASPWTEAEEAPAAVSEPSPPPIAFAPPPPVAAPASTVTPLPKAPAAAAGATNGSALSDSDVDRIARRVVELLGDRLVREVAWEVIPDMAEMVIKDRVRELERQLEGP